jgi:hypothetical protein
MTDDELVALEHENWIAYLTGVVRCTGRATVTRAAGVVTILTGLPFDWFNQILIEREQATPAGVPPGWPRRANLATTSWFACATASMIGSSRP